MLVANSLLLGERLVFPILAAGWILAQREPELPINRLDPVTRTKVIMALLALALLGLGAIVCIRLGGRWARRMAKSKPARSPRDEKPLPSDWDPKKD